MNSLVFYGTLSSGVNNSFLSVPLDASYNFGTNDFTIEWWQKMDATIGGSPRVFSIGDSNLGTVEIGVSVESGRIYYWHTNTTSYNYQFAYPNPSLLRTPYLGSWHHFAIVKNSSKLYLYLDGQQLKDFSNSSNAYFTDTIDYSFTQSKTLCIGAMTPVNVNSGECFKGYIDSFHWIVGRAKYTSNFSVPTQPPSLETGSRLLLDGTTLYTTVSGKPVQNTNVGSTTDDPFTSTQSNSSNTFSIKKSLLNRQDGSQVSARRRQSTESTVLSNYMSQRIYNKDTYQGTNDGYNAWHSTSQVRNGGAAVPKKATGGLGPRRVNMFFGQGSTY